MSMIVLQIILSLGICIGFGFGDSKYYVYTTADDQRCCSVRLGNEFCSAIPLTSRLILLDESCPRGQASEKGAAKSKDLDRIYRRLRVAETYHVGKKVLIHLDAALDKTILENNLLCLSLENNHINLDKCSIDLGVQANSSESINSIDVVEQIAIRPGQGLSIVQKYELNVTNIRIKDRLQRQCYDWYRKQTKNICRDPCSHPRECLELNDQRERCLERLMDSSSNATEDSKNYERIDLTRKAKLICENNKGQMRVLGRYRRSQLCFHTHYQISVEHQFSDRVYLSDKHQNKDILQFIANSTDLAKEFESDCHDKETLANLAKEEAKEEKEEQEKEHSHDEP